MNTQVTNGALLRRTTVHPEEKHEDPKEGRLLRPRKYMYLDRIGTTKAGNVSFIWNVQMHSTGLVATQRSEAV